MLSEVGLLEALVAIPSVSGDEDGIARYLEATVRGWDANLAVARDDTGVKVTADTGRPGPTLGLLSHLDVVPPGDGWTKDPFTPTIEEGRLYGRGSGDAKASVATMLLAAYDWLGLARGSGAGGKVIVVLGFGEETKHTTMGRAIASLPPLDAAVIGEPTSLDIAVAQRGLMMVDLIARGDQRHAGYASEGGFTSAITGLAGDLVRLPHLLAERTHPILGRATVTATMIEAGVSRNVTPAVARAVLDIRSTPSWTHREIGAALTNALASEVAVTSERLVPCETPPGSQVLAAAKIARPSAKRYGSPTCSDWVFVNHLDAIKVGPGTSRRSHTADESVDLAEVTEARRFYRDLALAYLQ